jgi:hypothetical protein
MLVVKCKSHAKSCYPYVFNALKTASPCFTWLDRPQWLSPGWNGRFRQNHGRFRIRHGLFDGVRLRQVNSRFDGPVVQSEKQYFYLPSTRSIRSFGRNTSAGTPNVRKKCAAHALSVYEARFIRQHVNGVASLFNHQPRRFKAELLHGFCQRQRPGL